MDGLHNNAPLTAFAAATEKPVITVNIGYRLNWLSGLVCHDLLTEAGSRQSPYGPFNLHIQDQRLAFEWIDRFIGGFGGDRKNTTAFGESAGSVFLVHHICGSSSRLFNRAILQSGCIFGDVSFEVKEAEYQALLKHFRIEEATAEERLDALRKVDASGLAKYPVTHMTLYTGPVPGVDIKDSLFTRGVVSAISQMELVPSCSWLSDVIIGDNFYEGDITYPVTRHLPQETFVSVIGSLFPISQAQNLLQIYGLAAPISPTRAGKQMALFLGDLLFSFPTDLLAQALSSYPARRKGRRVFRYHMCFSNPFPGSAHSQVVGHHFVEILFIFLTLLERYPTTRNDWVKRQALNTVARWLAFAHGEEPWAPFHSTLNEAGCQDTDCMIAIADDLIGWTVRTMEEDEAASRSDPWGERRYKGWRAFQDAFNALKQDGAAEEVHRKNVTIVRLKLMGLVYGIYGAAAVIDQSDWKRSNSKSRSRDAIHR